MKISKQVAKEIVAARPKIINSPLCVSHFSIDGKVYFGLTDNNGHIFSKSDIDEILSYIQPFYSLPNSDKIVKANNDEFLKQFLGLK